MFQSYFKTVIAGCIIGACISTATQAQTAPPALPPIPLTSPAAKTTVDLPAFPTQASQPAPAAPPVSIPQNTPAASPTTATPVSAPALPAPVVNPPPVTAQPVSPLAATPKALPQTPEKEPDYLAIPYAIGKKSLIFSSNDIDVINQLLVVYDNTELKKLAAPNTSDDLNNLLKELTAKHPQQADSAPPPALPNLYLSSILYYTPSHWSIWINDKKLVNVRNTEGAEFYVTRISRTQVELVWKPQSLLDIPATWNQRTENGKNPLPNITVDASGNTITLIMHPNQTFIPRTLAIQEGFVKSPPVYNNPPPAP